MDPSPTADALCAVHPERPALATCRRCGSFMCEECRSEALPERCAACERHLAGGRFVNHVPILGIVMIVHGLLMGGMGLYLLVFGGFFAQSLAESPPADAPDDPLGAVMVGAFSVIGVAHLLPAALQVWAGVRLRSFRSRALALTVLALGLLTVLGCYCSPSSLGLLTWGVVVLTRDDVSARFAPPRASGT